MVSFELSEDQKLLKETVAAFATDDRIGVVFGNVLPAKHDRATGFVPVYLRTSPFLARSLDDKGDTDGMGACMGLRRSVWSRVGGFDERCLPDAWADVDLCLKMRRAGYLIVYTPFAKLYRHRSQNAHEIDWRAKEIICERWAGVLERDPYYNPNLSRARADFSLGT